MYLFKDLFEEYVVENHFNDLLEVMKKEDPEKHYGVVIKYYYFHSILLKTKCFTCDKKQLYSFQLHYII